MTALDFANKNENVIVRYASVGAPEGADIALLPETELPFNLEQIEGELDADGDFTATNLNDGNGAHGWKFRDFNGNYIYALWLRIDAKKWQEEYAESMSDA